MRGERRGIGPCRQQREALAPGRHGEMAVEGEEYLEGPHPPAQRPHEAREDVAGEDRDDRPMDVERPLAVEEELAERGVVVEVDEAEKRGGAARHETDVAPADRFLLCLAAEEGTDPAGGLAAASHPPADARREERIDERGGGARQEKDRGR